MSPSISQVVSFIEAHWHETIREMLNDEGDLIGMPFPYTVPSHKAGFQELYYRDTFYTNEGLISAGRVDLARNNTDDLLSLVDRFGFAANGLNRFGTHDDSDHEFDDNFPRYRNYYRLPLVWPEEREALKGQLRHQHAECESGWDFTPRFDRRCADFTPIDRNSLQYEHEQIVRDLNAALGRETSAKCWHELGSQRRQLIQKLLFSAKLGAFIDLDHANNQPGQGHTTTIFYLRWLQVDTPAQAVATTAQLPRLEAPHGIQNCELGNTWPFSYQWETPNGWPPLHYVAVRGLQASGMVADGLRIARKYLDMVAQTFEQTGDLWEKYLVVNGSIETVDSYEMPTMLGWTAGVFAALAAEISK